MRGTMLPINSAKLGKELARRGLSKEAAGKELGHSTAYMGLVLKRGTIAKSDMLAISQRWNIHHKDIAPGEDEPIPEMPTADVTLKLVEEGVYRALARALPEFEEAMYNAMRRALND